MIPTRTLGRELKGSAVGLGCISMPHFSGHADERESIATIHRALESGVNFFDTAEAYGPFTNEELLGRALKGRFDRVIIATKFGYRIEHDKTTGTNSQPAHIREVVQASLRRLRTDHI